MPTSLPLEPQPRLDASEATRLAALFLPAALFVSPLLRDSLTPVSEGAGWCLLGLLPLAALLCWPPRPIHARALSCLLASLVFGMAARAFTGDRFEADRALCSACASAVAFLGAARASVAGRRWIARGLVLATLAWIGGALIDGLLDPARGFTGLLGNSGDTSEACLPGALAGIVLAADRRGETVGWRSLGLGAALAQILYAGLMPVWAGAAGVLAAVACGLVVGRARPHARYRARIGLMLALVLSGLLALGHWVRPRPEDASTPEVPPAQAVAADFGSTGGFSVRWLVWGRVPALLAAHPWIGVGPGQFERAYPPYRDPAEIELSTQHHRTPSPIEVEHPHNEWLLILAEDGLLGGGLRIAFLLTMLVLAVGALASAETGLAAAGSAAIGVLANACFNGPLFENAASSVLAFACFGALAGRASTVTRPALVARMAALLVLGLALLLTLPALSLARHGRALAELAHARTVEIEGGVRQLAEDIEPIVARALARRPDSVVALSKRAQLLRSTMAPSAERIAVWERVLAIRPYRFEALLALANEHARERRYELASELYARAEALDAADPNLARNQVQLALDAGEAGDLAAALARATSLGPLPVDWLARAAANVLFYGRVELARPLLLAMGEGIEPPGTGEEAKAVGLRMRAAGHALLADALEVSAHQLWARSHIEAGKPGDAVRSYRQALRLSAPHEEDGRTSIWLEYVAALLLDEDIDGARKELGTWMPAAGAHEIDALPAWAAAALRASGLLQLE